jgi:hypothetical protein
MAWPSASRRCTSRTGDLTTRFGDTGGELVRGTEIVARSGQEVTLFGGAGSDGALAVCGVEELHEPFHRRGARCYRSARGSSARGANLAR